MNKQNVIVLGRNYTSILGMVRALGDEFDITVIKVVGEVPSVKDIKSFVKRIICGQSPELYSKYIKEYFYTIEPNREDLIHLLLSKFENLEKKIILMPTDDYSASTIDLYQDVLKDKFLFPSVLNKQGEIVKLMNKDYQKQIARENNLLCPDGFIVDDKTEKLPKDIKYPVFTKPQISFKGSKKLMKKCLDNDQLSDILKDAKRNSCPVLVEQFINIEKEYAVLGYCYNGNVLMPGIIQMKKSGNGSHKGVTMIGDVKKFDVTSEIYIKLQKFIKSLQFNGLFDIDLYENDGKIYFNELNLRFGASGYAITSLGTNLPKMFIYSLLGKNVDKLNISLISEKEFVNEKVAFEDYEANFLSWNEYKNIINNNSLKFVLSDDDIKPYKKFKKKERYIRFMKSIKRIAGRK